MTCHKFAGHMSGKVWEYSTVNDIQKVIQALNFIGFLSVQPSFW